MTEITPDGTEVWNVEIEQDLGIRRVYLLQDLYDLTDLGVGEPTLAP
jgi:hypothetical protein